MDREDVVFKLVTEELDNMPMSRVLELAFEGLAELLEPYSDSQLIDMYEQQCDDARLADVGSYEHERFH